MTVPGFHKFREDINGWAVSCLLMVLVVVLPAGAEQSSVPLPESPRITPTAPGVASETPEPVREGSDTALLRGEIAALRADLKHLRESLNLILNQITADLRRENELLRRENEQLRRQLQNQGISPDLPSSVKDILPPSGADSRLPSAFPEPGPAEVAASRSPEPVPEVQQGSTTDVRPADDVSEEPPAWEPVATWGREPEDARALGPDILSQKAVVGVIAPGAGRNALIALGRAIRRDYDRYDIISVDIFDDRNEAEAYARNRHPDPTHRVLTVSRHVRTGRDIILLYRDGLAEEIPPAP